MKPINKWVSTAAIAVAMLLTLYYAGVMNSKIAVGIAVTAMGGILLLSAIIVTRPGK